MVDSEEMKRQLKLGNRMKRQPRSHVIALLGLIAAFGMIPVYLTNKHKVVTRWQLI